MTDAGYRMKNPSHPGGFIRREIIDGFGLSLEAAAKALGVTEAAVSPLLDEQVALSPEMALRVEKAFGVSMDTLMRMQSHYDIAYTRRREADIHVEPYVPAMSGEPSLS